MPQLADTSNFSAAEALEAQRIQNEHEQKTIWRKDLILTIAKAISLTAISISCSIGLYLTVKQQNNELLSSLAQILMYVLSFFAGRSTRLRDKD